MTAIANERAFQGHRKIASKNCKLRFKERFGHFIDLEISKVFEILHNVSSNKFSTIINIYCSSKNKDFHLSKYKQINLSKY